MGRRSSAAVAALLASVVALWALVPAAAAQTAVGSTWRFLGPSRLVPLCAGNCNVATPTYVAGRVDGLLWHGGTLYAATAYGGVWRWSAGAGAWRDMTPLGPVLATGAIANAAGGTLYVATGTAQDRAGAGDGILRLAPGKAPAIVGASARVAGLPILSPSDAAALLSYEPAVGGPPELLVANAYGIFRSVDGGRTWATSRATGDTAPDYLLVGGAMPPPLLQSPANPAVVYTDMGPWLLRSNDFGRTWSRVSSALPNWSRGPRLSSLALAASPSDPAVLYASLESQVGVGGHLENEVTIYQSRDGGRAWAAIFQNHQPGFLQYPGYSNVLSVNPANPDNLWVGLVHLMEIRNAGTDEQGVNGDVLTDLNGQATVDIHALAWHDGALYVGGDQGVFVVQPGNRPTVTSLNVGMGDVLDYGGLAAYGSGGIIVVGTQDNGETLYLASARANRLAGQPLPKARSVALPAWLRPDACGDGGPAAIAPVHPGVIWVACARAVSAEPFLIDVIEGSWPGLTVGPPSHVTPYDEVTALWLGDGKAPLMGTSDGVLFHVLASPEGPWYQPTLRTLWQPAEPRWCAKSGDEAVTAIASGRAQVRLAADGCGLVGISTDGGDSWRTLMPRGGPDLRRWPRSGNAAGGLNAMSVGPRGVVYLGYGSVGPFAHAQEARWGWGEVCALVLAADRCAPLGGRLPPVESLVLEPDGTLLAGTSLGVWSLPEGARTWERSAGMPPVAVTSLVLAGSRRVLAGTYGRGVWSLQV